MAVEKVRGAEVRKGDMLLGVTGVEAMPPQRVEQDPKQLKSLGLTLVQTNDGLHALADSDEATVFRGPGSGDTASR